MQIYQGLKNILRMILLHYSLISTFAHSFVPFSHFSPFGNLLRDKYSLGEPDGAVRPWAVMKSETVVCVKSFHKASDYLIFKMSCAS